MTDALPEAHDAEMQHNTYTDGEVTVGASFRDFVKLDDTLPWKGSMPKVIIVMHSGNCPADLSAAFTDPGIMNKDVNIKQKLLDVDLEEGEGPWVHG